MNESYYTEDQMEKDNILSIDVITKYKTAADIANFVMKKVVHSTYAGQSISEICKLGDSLITEQVSNIFKKRGIEKGIAFPTCLNLNNIAQNYSPLSHSVHQILTANDVVKIELGVHVDGYIATLAHTVVVSEKDIEATSPLLGRAADAICAAYYGLEIASRMIKPGNKSVDVKNAIQKVAAAFKCQPCNDTDSRLMKRYILESDKHIPNVSFSKDFNPSSQYDASSHELIRSDMDYEEETFDDFEFKTNEVYSVNIVISSGSGQLRESLDEEFGILQRDVNQKYNLKLKSSKICLETAMKHFSVFPFSTRGLLDIDERLKLGLPECISHNLLCPLPVKEEGANKHSTIAQFKCTLLLMPNGKVERITAGEEMFGLPYVHSDFNVESSGMAEILKLNLKNVGEKLGLMLPSTSGDAMAMTID
ncbi:Proliferation-associated protein 2G4 [Lobulomyces angularis]|nr:Proliferation-associated protein 2G4 [Lobulomyces angularis]